MSRIDDRAVWDTRLRWTDKGPRRFRLPQLTDLQLAALAAIRDGEAEKYEKRVGYERFVAYRCHGHDITCQVQALKKRRLIRYSYDGAKGLALTQFGVEALTAHPEF